jgi:hypothetical protein
VSVSVARGAGEDQYDHVRAESPDVVHHVAQDLVTIPLLEGFIRRLGESEIDSAGEVLLGPIDSSGSE